jgi:uncharacterized membrane protein
MGSNGQAANSPNGSFEIAAGLGLLIERTAPLTARFLILFFIAIFPANIWAAFNHIDYGGHSLGPAYLLVRGPLQVLLVVWSWGISRSERKMLPDGHLSPVRGPFGI